ncbi:hypothetical protein ACH47Z_44255 [Streptomyces sp. NPDC020192]|uniref:hypothetical protein n=1 Tax=Streptomyces sp. NPDC020192 TaxID=3365066 RepID=UPI0037B633DD
MLAWRVYTYDRRAIVALSRNALPGPFVGKEGLDYELGKVVEAKDKEGNFTLLHDLTSVLRVLDVTELRPDGSRMLQEVKSSTASSATTKAHRQLKQAERLRAAIDGSQPLPGKEATQLWRSTTQLRTHVRDISPLLGRAEKDGYAATVISDRVIGVLNLLTAARDGHSGAGTPTPVPQSPAPPPGPPSATRPTEDNRDPPAPQKDQKCRSHDSDTRHDVTPHGSHDGSGHQPMAASLLTLNAPPAKTPRPEMPSLTPTH